MIKTLKPFFYNFFYVYFIIFFQLDIIKKQRKDSKDFLWKLPKSFWRRKRKWDYGHNQYKSLSESEKQKLVECRKIYHELQKHKGWLMCDNVAILEMHLK